LPGDLGRPSAAIRQAHDERVLVKTLAWTKRRRPMVQRTSIVELVGIDHRNSFGARRAIYYRWRGVLKLARSKVLAQL
jgi:hypothetical protein